MKKGLGSVKKEDLIKLEEGEKLYDIPKEMVEEYDKFSPKNGRGAIDKIFELAERYENRTFEMVKRVAKKTGINFPHLFQSYVEFFLNIALKAESYNVKESTTKALRIEVYGCPFYGKWCDECQNAFYRINEICNTKALFSREIKDGTCILKFQNL